MKHVLVLSAAKLCVVLLWGCRLFTTSCPAQVILPDPTTAGFPDDQTAGWEIRWLSGDGDIRNLICGRESPVVIDLPRERPLVISARLLTETGSIDFFPAGYVGREHSGHQVELSWLDGFTADYLLDLARSGIDPAMINVERFRDTVRRRCDGNPWYLDTRRLTEELLAGELWTYSFRPLDRHDIQLEFDPGCWYHCYIPDGSFESDGDSREINLPAGTHSFLRFSDESVLVVTVDSDGRYASIQR